MGVNVEVSGSLLEWDCDSCGYDNVITTTDGRLPSSVQCSICGTIDNAVYSDAVAMERLGQPNFKDLMGAIFLAVVMGLAVYGFFKLFII